MTKKQQKHLLSIEKTLSLIGISLVALGTVASLYYGYANRVFFESSPLLSAHYLNYAILLAGGFAAGYFLTPKASRKNRVFAGSSYALAAFLVFLLFDVFRLLVRPLLNDTPGVVPGFPGTIEGALFSLSPVIALAITILIAFIFQYRSRAAALTSASMRMFVVTFLLAEIYFAAQILDYSITSVQDSSYASPMWLTVAGYVTNPLVIALVSFLLLGAVASKMTRTFYAVFVATSMTLFMQLLWNFNTNPSAEWGTAFQTGVFVVMTTAYVAVMLKIRQGASSR